MYEVQEVATEKAEQLEVTPVPSLNLVYSEEEGYVTAEEANEKGNEVKKLSGTRFRTMLREGENILEWFELKSVVKVLGENA